MRFKRPHLSTLLMFLLLSTTYVQSNVFAFSIDTDMQDTELTSIGSEAEPKFMPDSRRNRRPPTAVVGDEVPPTISVPADITVDTTSITGTAVTYDVTATDNYDTTVPVACTPESGSNFSIGTTEVSCTASDAAGNTASATFNVHVNYTDEVPPTISVPADITVDTTSITGTAVTYDVTATDNYDTTVPVACTPESGSNFSIGTTEVSCTASDAAGNTASATFDVIVEDATPPMITPPADITTEATGSLTTVSLGTDVVSDLDDPLPTVINDAPAAFPLGITVVTWTATDSSGNSATATQSVTIVDTITPNTKKIKATDGDGKTLMNNRSTRSTSITFTFGGTDNIAIAGFQCSLDGEAFSDCTSGINLTGLSAGNHNFQVRTLDTSGNVDPTPSSFSWKIESNYDDDDGEEEC